MMRVALKDTSNVLYFENMRDEITNEPVIDATVSATIYDVYGDEVADQLWPLTLVYQDGTDGDYMGVLSDQIDLVVGNYYKTKLTVRKGNYRLTEEHEIEIVKRLP